MVCSQCQLIFSVYCLFPTKSNHLDVICCMILQATGAVLLTIKEFDKVQFAISSVYHPPLIPLYKQVVPRPMWYPLQKQWAFKNEANADLMQKLIDSDLAGELLLGSEK